MFFWKNRMQFWQSCRKICTRSSEKTFEPKTFSNEGFWKKMFFWNYGQQFWQSCWKIFNRSPKNIHDTIKLFKQKFSLKLFLRGLRLQFWQYCRKFFARSSKKIYKSTIFSIKSFFLKCCSGKAHCGFENLAEMFLSEVEKNSGTYNFFRTKIFTQNVPLEK